MKTLKAFTLLTIMTTSILMSSCSKSNEILNSSNSEIERSEIPPLFYLIAVVYVVVKNTEGQKSTLTKTMPDGTTETITTCTGLGTCIAGISFNGNDIGTQNEYTDLEDYILHAEFGKTNSNLIILKVNKSNAEINNIFYSDEINFLSDDYLIDNSDFLNQLSLTHPFEIKAGKYKVWEQEDFKYIIVHKID